MVTKEEREKLLREGFAIAASYAEVSTWDGWHITNPRVDLDEARKQLEGRIASWVDAQEAHRAELRAIDMADDD